MKGHRKLIGISQSENTEALIYAGSISQKRSEFIYLCLCKSDLLLICRQIYVDHTLICILSKAASLNSEDFIQFACEYV